MTQITKEKLVYLHIEKSAGTSQRVLFYSLIGTDNVFWHGTNKEETQHPASKEADYIAVGGHRKFDYYSPYESSVIFTAIVRDPVERIASLFNYDRKNNLERFQPYGFDPYSIKKTLKNCKPYIKKIQNAQCRYLSGQENFKDTLNTINKSAFLIGDYKELDSFNSFLCDKLGLMFKSTPRTNVGEAEYLSSIDIDDEVLDLIMRHTSEDRKLYEYVSHQKIICTVKPNEWGQLKSYIYNHNKDIPSVKIFNLTKVSNKRALLNLVVENILPEKLLITEKNINFSYEVFYLNNKPLIQKTRINLPEFSLAPYEVKTIALDLDLVRSINKSCRFSIYLEAKERTNEKILRTSDEKLLFLWS